MLPIYSLLLREGRNSRKPAAKRKAQQHRHSTAAVFKRTRHRPLNPLPLSHLELISWCLPPSSIFLGAVRAPSTPVSLPCRLPPVRFHLSWYSVCFNARRRREELSSTSLIALESEVVGAGEEEEGRGYMAPKEGILRLPPLLSPSLREILRRGCKACSSFFILCPSIHSSVDFAGCRGGKLREFGRRRW